MTVQQNDTVERVVINGVGSYSFSFRIFTESDLVVTAISPEGIPTQFVDSVNYTVQGVDSETGGTILLDAGTATAYNGYTLDIRSNVETVQPTRFKYLSQYNPVTLEQSLDRLARQNQDERRILSAAIRAPDYEVADFELPYSSARASKTLGFDSEGNLALQVPSTSLVTAEIIADLLIGSPSQFTNLLQNSPISQVLNPLTSAENALGVTPVSYAYEFDFIERQGASTASTDNLVALNKAISLCTIPALNIHRHQVRSGDGTFVISAAPTNPYGVELAGYGAIMEQFTAYGGTRYRQLNTYANHRAGPAVIGKEYLYKLYNLLIQNPGTGINVEVYGDSTVAGSNGESSQLLIQNILPNLAFRSGLPEQLYVTNRGVGGTNWADFNPTAELNAGNMHVLMVKFGINDGSNPYATRLATMVTTMRAKLAAVRAHANGSLEDLSIVLLGPTSTNDPPFQKDTYWYEQLRGAYVQAARDYQCLYVDLYAMLQDSRWSAGLDMDAPYGDDRAVHPLNERLLWIWPAVFRAMFGWEETRFLARNNFLNLSADMGSGTATTSQAPSLFPYGISLYRAPTGSGWPYDGVVRVTKNADDPVLQELFPFGDANRTVVPKRLSYVVGDSWTTWTGVAQALTLANGWVTFQLGINTPTATLGDDGTVTVNAVIKSGTTTATTVVTTLPLGMRPPAPMLFPGAGSSLNPQIRVDTNGNVSLQTTGDATYTILAFTFKAT